MTLEHWLAEATWGLPAAARLRLEAEYRAHWEARRCEANHCEAGNDAGPLDLFGPPQTVRLALRRLYLSQRQLDWRRSRYSLGMLVNLLGVTAAFVLTLGPSLARLPFWIVLALPAPAATLFGLASLTTRRLERVQRSFVMDVVCVLLCCALPTLLLLATWPTGQRLDGLLPSGWPLALLGAGMLGLGGMLWHEIRFRRTLALIGAALI
ncbi:hypothetical protein GCM10022631_40860 [Deinococcus rubellus]|uniref:Uncharacterized protein n=1 Tax=Deinococcus rubellus TaxID=1889240 RepID=A0ABY5YFL3_9DEIO|nr:hypothetical protein [Deinococcus rubellus]UWX63875.1 hypothetical protein N0D28_14285 [Deinococcus rubellus]